MSYINKTVAELKEILRKKGKPVSGTKEELIKRIKSNSNSGYITYKGERIKENIVNKDLYIRVRNRVKKRVKAWPSAYASGQVIKEYKAAGGTFRGEKNRDGLDRWFQERWVDLSKPLGGGRYAKCGRERSSVRAYPYCRPTVRVSSRTPMTVNEIKRKHGQQYIDNLVKKKRRTALPEKGISRQVKKN